MQCTAESGWSLSSLDQIQSSGERECLSLKIHVVHIQIVIHRKKADPRSTDPIMFPFQITNTQHYINGTEF